MSIFDVLRKYCSYHWTSLTSNSVRAVGSCPELFLHILLAEKPAVHVEAEHAIEHVHAVRVSCHGPEEVAVWVGSKNGRMANLLTSCGHVVKRWTW